MFSAKFRKKSIGKMKHMLFLPVLLVPVVALIMGASAPEVWASGRYLGECDEFEIEEAAVFIEFNASDLDLGFHLSWDGDPYRSMTLKNEAGQTILNVLPRRYVRLRGLTQTEIEGAEPGLCDEEMYPYGCEIDDENIMQGITDFFNLHPAGLHTFKGIAAEERCLMEKQATLTHNLLEPAELHFGAFPLITWDAPEGRLYGGPLEVDGYEIVVEMAVVNSPESVFKETATFPGNIDPTEYTVSQEFQNFIEASIIAGIVTELKVEIQAREPSGNLTSTEEEVCYEVVGEEVTYSECD